jgi:hypothetical protein
MRELILAIAAIAESDMRDTVQIIHHSASCILRLDFHPRRVLVIELGSSFVSASVSRGLFNTVIKGRCPV